MTSEEKAKELVDKFREYVKDTSVKGYLTLYDRREEVENATQCAIIAVEEIITAVKLFPDLQERWNEVLTHLKNKS